MAKKKTNPARRDEEETDGTLETEEALEAKPPAPRTCRDRKERRKVLPLIADALIDRALEGSVSHVKSLIELGVYEPGALRARSRKRLSTAELLQRRWEQEKQTP